MQHPLNCSDITGSVQRVRAAIPALLSVLSAPLGKKKKTVKISFVACLNWPLTTRGPCWSRKLRNERPKTLNIRQTQNVLQCLVWRESNCDPAVPSHLLCLPNSGREMLQFISIPDLATCIFFRLQLNLIRTCPSPSHAWAQTAKASTSTSGATSSCQPAPKTTMKHWMRNCSIS